MIKNGIICLLSSVVLNTAAQNQVQQFYSNVNLANQSYVQQRANPVLASNVSNINKANTVKVNATNSNKRTTVNQTVQRRPVQQSAQRNANPPVQIQNEDIQIQTNVSDNNVGNELNNFEVIQIQHLSNVAVPAIPQIGNAGMELKLPKVNLGVSRMSRKSVKSGSSNHSKKKIVQIKNKIKKANRKWCTKLEGKKKLRLKVDRCFNW